ncbi:uncharacterized protein Z518_09246 [Rhinocladiella mackenziei CBS 650.93]|uniref:Uncharacterized protein n=1 Tax=Rhinocladiella mackenziei CBS 650.93 TaxID=1442369 RepID=A0A0D2IY99_9EURO|nr:uncharacterized protein Z518_09246 [Rhinocladiella mackenziei CBS 650.93]KIX01520.1 hypothetical protein Z518_09246 [Rhinocladiella mackenziei CBS 650.93]
MAGDNENADFKLYQYDPSLTAAVIFIILFLLITLLHTYQLVRTRTWYFIPFCIGGYFQWIGYIGRAIGSQESPDWSVGAYVLQSILILVAPALFAASIYMELGRVIRLTDGAVHSVINTRWLTKIFVAGDVLSFLMQGSGGGIMASGTESSMTTGEKIIIGGLVLQILFFSFFIIVGITFHIRMHRMPTSKVLSSGSTAHVWKKHLYALYGGSLLILVRSVFRLIEYAQGNDGYLISHEVYLYIFDSVLMVAAMILFAVIHPSEVNAMCDERGPICSNCVARELDCSYVHQQREGINHDPVTTAATAGLDPDHNPPSLLHHSTHESQEVANGGRVSKAYGHDDDISAQRILELELMHHYSTSTYKSCVGVSDNTIAADIWQRFVPMQGLKHDFLLHGILAFAALHMATKLKQSTAEDASESREPDVSFLLISGRSPSFYFRKALEYQNMAFASFHSVLPDVTQANCDAVFAFSILTMLLAIAIPQQSAFFSTTTGESVVDRNNLAGKDNLDFASNPNLNMDFHLTPLQSIFTLFEFLKGVGSIVQVSREWLHGGPFRFLINRYAEYWDWRWRLADPDVIEALCKLRELNERLNANVTTTTPQGGNQSGNRRGGTSTVLEINDSAISQLEFSFAKQGPVNTETPISTPASRSPSASAFLSASATGAVSVPTPTFTPPSSYRDRGHIIGWLAMAGKDFISCLRDGNSVSLLIFLHWAVLLDCLDDVDIFWWSRGSGKALVKNVSEILHLRGPEWVERTAWARTKVGLA